MNNPRHLVSLFNLFKFTLQQLRKDYIICYIVENQEKIFKRIKLTNFFKRRSSNERNFLFTSSTGRWLVCKSNTRQETKQVIRELLKKVHWIKILCKKQVQVNYRQRFKSWVRSMDEQIIIILLHPIYSSSTSSSSLS